MNFVQLVLCSVCIQSAFILYKITFNPDTAVHTTITAIDENLNSRTILLPNSKHAAKADNINNKRSILHQEDYRNQNYLTVCIVSEEKFVHATATTIC